METLRRHGERKTNKRPRRALRPPARWLSGIQWLSLGLLREITGNARNRRFRFDPYLRVFEDAG